MPIMSHSHLNSAQTRAQDLLEDLKNLDLDHLQSFMEGVCDPEPPAYKKVNGKIEPPLAKITLREGANVYRLGNVVNPEDNSIYNADCVVENNKLELLASEPLPQEPSGLLSHPIIDEVMSQLIDHWGEKFKAIKQRIAQLNDLRTQAYNSPNQPGTRLSYGKVSYL